MTVFVASLGCSKNGVDSEYLMGALEKAGYTVVETPDLATIIIVNTCGFITTATEEAIQTILELATLKKEGRCKRLIVCGCMVQRYGKEIVEELPEVDFFTGVGGIEEIMATLSTFSEKFVAIDPARVPLYTSKHPRYFPSDQTTGYIKISEGCNRHCTYCIIPTLRGPQRSRTIADILGEARMLVEKGAKEIILVAQETTAWGSDLLPSEKFENLLEELAKQEPNIWIRFLYGHPQSISNEVIQVVKKYKQICSYFDIPIQHAASSVLKRMGRSETKEDLRALIQEIRTEIPTAVIRTTVIVGFPGETKEEYKELTEFIEEIQFDHLGAFLYSAEKDLPSWQLPQPVSPQTAKRRYNRLMEKQQDIATRKNQHYIGRTVSVLVEEKIENNVFIGRAFFQAPEVDGEIWVSGKNIHIGDIVPVKITQAHPYDLEGITV